LKYTHIVFDIDGTLLDNENAVLSSLQDVLRKVLAKEFLKDELRFVIGITSEIALAQLGIEDLEHAKQLWLDYYPNYADSIFVYNGIADCLKLLHEQGYVLGILTSKTALEYQKEFAPLGLSQYFDVVVCADDTIEHKPNPGPMLEFLKQAKAEANSTLYIGDTVHDMHCAQEAGADFVLALWGCKSPELVSTSRRLSSPAELNVLLSEATD